MIEYFNAEKNRIERIEGKSEAAAREAVEAIVASMTEEDYE